MSKIIAIILLFISQYCLAQVSLLDKNQASDIVKRINEETLNAKYFSADLLYRVYSTHSDTMPYDSISGYYRRSGINEHSFLLGIETIQNQDERLVLDSGTRSAYLSAPSAKPQLVEASMNAAIQLCSKITHTKKAGLNTIKMFIDDKAQTGFNAVEITYNPENWLIGSISLYYTNAVIPGYDDFRSPKVQIVYKGLKTSRIKDSEFSTETFLKKEGETITLKTTNTDYTFFNTLN